MADEDHQDPETAPADDTPRNPYRIIENSNLRDPFKSIADPAMRYPFVVPADTNRQGPSEEPQLPPPSPFAGWIQRLRTFTATPTRAYVSVSIHRQSRWLYGCWPLKGAFSQPSEAKARTKAKTYCCLHCRSTGNSRENILPEFSKFDCHPGRAGGSPFWIRHWPRDSGWSYHRSPFLAYKQPGGAIRFRNSRLHRRRLEGTFVYQMG
jgi:hypothetical protein